MNTYLITYRFRRTWRGYQTLVQASNQDEAQRQFLAGRFGSRSANDIIIESIQEDQ